MPVNNCCYGLAGDDAEDEDPSSENPFALAGNNEDLYIDDPKKTLRGWFEREGYELQYNVEEKGYSHFVCTVELPIDTATGAPAIAEASVKGKKKEAVIACALEACRILDQHGELRKSCHEARKRKEKNWEENDFYDSDEDTFLDRTGTIEKKREMRRKMMKKEATEVDTYDTLLEKLRIVEERIGQVQAKLEESKRASERAENEADDSLEAFMNALKSRSLEDKTQRSRWRQELAGLLQERLRLTRVRQHRQACPLATTHWSIAKATSQRRGARFEEGSPNDRVPQEQEKIGHARAREKSCCMLV
ncbi:hypothetical protein MRX96_048606 [Rhipicephalus microplus]